MPDDQTPEARARRIEEIEDRLRRATPGPWYWWMSEHPPWDLGSKAQHPKSSMGISVSSSISDAEFVASSWEDIAFLLSALRDAEAQTLKRVIARLDQELDAISEAQDPCGGEAFWAITTIRNELAPPEPPEKG
jgi:hypothetical protein